MLGIGRLGTQSELDVPATNQSSPATFVAHVRVHLVA